MLSSKCPSCNIPIQLKGEFSTHVVCPHCQSVLSKAGDELKATGEKGALQPDHTLLQIGTLINYQKQSFEVVGRIQFFHSTGFWNEWHLLDQRGESWWLGEAMGEYFLFQEKIGISTPKKESLKLGEEIPFETQKSILTQIVFATVKGIEGELSLYLSPDTLSTSYEFRTQSKRGFSLKYRSPQDQFGSLYEGDWLNVKDLTFQKTKNLESFNHPDHQCQRCHTPFKLYLGGASHLYRCPHCESLYDTSSSEPKLLSQVDGQVDGQEDLETPLQIGDLFTYQKIQWRCVSIALKKSDSVRHSHLCNEHLLFHPQQGYRWLSLANGRWSWSLQIPQLPSTEKNPLGKPTLDENPKEGRRLYTPNQCHLEGSGTFSYFSPLETKTIQALGEIHQEIEQECCYNYIAPPKMLSCREKVDQQLCWFLTTEVPLEKISKQFPDRSFPQPEPTALSPFQTNPYRESSKKGLLFLLAILALFFSLVFYQISSEKKVYSFSHPVSFGQSTQNQVQQFLFKENGSMDLTFAMKTLGLDYCHLKVFLIHKESQTHYSLQPFLTQKSNVQTFYLRGMPKGSYTLAWNTHYDLYDSKFIKERRNRSSSFQNDLLIEIHRSSFTPLAFALSLVLLVSIAQVPALYVAHFEHARWSQGDGSHPTPFFHHLINLHPLNPIALLTALITIVLFKEDRSHFLSDISGSQFLLGFLILTPLFFLPLLSLYYAGAPVANPKQSFFRSPKGLLVLFLLALFACNSFFGYGCSSRHTLLQGKEINLKEPFQVEPFKFEPHTLPPGGVRSFES